MHKIFTTAVAVTVMVISSYAQVGSCALGAGMALGVINTGQGDTLGKSAIATSVKCNAACTNIYPVTGLNLQGNRLSQALVRLSWFTLLETNNKGFYIQRSLGSATAFKTVGFTVGAGNSIQKNNYAFNDTNSFASVTYYRLQQVDNDGAFVFSNVIGVKGISSGSLVIMPNPARNQCWLQLPTAFAAAKVQVTLYSISGKVVLSKFYSADNNANIQLSNLLQLKAGLYIVTVDNGTNSLRGKLTILK